MTFFSTTITPTTSAQPLMTNKIGIQKITQLMLSVRSMGTATFVSIGGRDTQDRRLIVVGDNLSIDVPQGKNYLDIRSLFVISDTADAVLEIVGDSYEGN